MSQFEKRKAGQFQVRLLGKQDSNLIEAFYDEPIDDYGLISLKLDRTPDIWGAFQVEGRKTDVLAVIDMDLNKVAVAMICSQKKGFIHGKSITFGYVSSLRVGNNYQGFKMWDILFRYFKEYCESAKAFVWLFSVFSNNKKAIHFFEKTHESLPIFIPLEERKTFVFKKRNLSGRKNLSGVVCRMAKPDDTGKIVEFIRMEGENRAFVPDYKEEELKEGKWLLSGLKIEDIVVAEQQNQLCGIMGIWDQRQIRKWKVVNYHPFLKLFRPIINLITPLIKFPKLPPIGGEVNYLLISLMLVKNNDVELQKYLLNSLMNVQRNNRQVYSINLRKDDPLCQYLKSQSIEMNNMIYIAYQPKYKELVEKLNLKNLYIEQGGL